MGNKNEIKENKIKNQVKEDIIIKGESYETLNIINIINTDYNFPFENNYFDGSLNEEVIKSSIDKNSPIKGEQEGQNINICNSISWSLSEEVKGDKNGLEKFMDENSESN